MSDAQPGHYDEFATRAEEYDITLTRVPTAGATDAIADAVEEPAVGTALPWEGVDLPDSVATDPTPADLDAAVTGVTAADFAIADYGSLALRPTYEGSEPVSLFPDLHVAVLRESDIVPDMEAAFEQLGERFRESGGSAVLATGPSATADMGELVQGAHGPKEVHVVVIP